MSKHISSGESTMASVLYAPSQKKSRHQFGRWACANIINFNKAKYKVLNLRPGNPKHKHRLGGEETESSPAK